MKNKLVRRLALVLSVVMLITSTINTSFAYIVTKTDSIVNTFTPGESTTSGLTISKTVEHPYGQKYVIPGNIAFDFKVELGAYYANTTLSATAGGTMTPVTVDGGGSFTVSVKPGVPVTIEGIDEGTVVTVTEQATTLAGFAMKGNATQVVTLGTGGTATVAFVNTYTPQPVSVSVAGEKHLTGRPWRDGDSFTFKLERLNGNSQTELGRKTITYDAANAEFNKFNFGDITFTEIGEYQFCMTEVVENPDSNMDYDQSPKAFSVKVTDSDMDGKMEISEIAAVPNNNTTATKDATTGVYTVSAIFDNTYIAPITVPITVEKTVTNTGTATIGAQDYEFVLKNTAPGAESEPAKTLTINTDATVVATAAFDLTFTKADIGKVYTYALSETKGSVTDMDYDEKVYAVSVAITKDTGNKLAADVTMTLNGNVVTGGIAAFVNTYSADLPVPGDPDDISVPITVNKTVKSTGTGTISPANFEFVLENTENGSKLTMKTDANGKAVFALPFTAADIDKTYTYKLSEVKGNVSGVTYDTDVYTITVAITEDTTNNKLLAALTMNGQSVNEVVADFENTYRATPTVTPSTPQPDSQQPESGDTGDNSKLNFWFMMMIVSGITTVTLLVIDRKYAKSKE